MRAVTGFAGVMALVYAGAIAAAAPAAKPDLARGQQLASTVCVACHGVDGVGNAPTNPHLAGQLGDYIAAQLAAYKSGARPNPIMQGMAAGLTAQDMAAVGAYYQSRKPVEGMARDKALAERGRQIWRAGVKSTGVPACSGCHGAAGAGIPAQYPRLAGQQRDLSLGWLKAYAAGTRPNAVMAAVATKLTEADMMAVSEYIAGLR